MRLLLAEDQTILRDALCQLLRAQNNVDSVFAAADGQEAWTFLEKESVDVAILDIEMPGLTGLEVLEKIKGSKLTTKVILVTTFKRPGYFERAIRLGVDAFVLKDRSIQELMNTIDRVLHGQKDYSPELMELVLTSANPLSEQEQAILREVQKGASNQDIAKALHLSSGTVRNYLSVILLKLGAKNRTDALRIASEKAWF